MNISNLLMNNYSVMTQMNTLQNKINENNKRLSTGMKLTKDNPSDILRISKLNSEIRGKQVGQTNIQDGISLIQTTDNALSNMSDISQRLKELSAQYNTGTLSCDDKTNIENEAKALTKEMSNIVKNTTFNGKNVFNEKTFGIMAGNNSSDMINIDIPKFKIDVIKTDTNAKKDTNSLKSSRLPVSTLKQDIENPLVSNLCHKTNISGSNLKSSSLSKIEKTTTEPQYIITSPTINIPSQNGYTGYKQIYDKKGELMYSGNLTNGKLNGFGILYNNGQEICSGNWNNNTISDGYCTIHNPNGTLKYDGNITNCKPDGFGSYYTDNGIIQYQGSFKDGYREGWGTTYDMNGTALESKSYDNYTTYINGSTPTNKPTGDNTNTNTNTNNNNNTNTSDTNSGSNTTGDSTTTSQIFSIKDIDTIDIKNILKTDFIDKNILNPISNIRNELATKEEILNFRANSLDDDINIKNENLSKIQDVDIAKELLNMNKNQILLNTNISIFSQTNNLSQNIVQMLLK